MPVEEMGRRDYRDNVVWWAILCDVDVLANLSVIFISTIRNLCFRRISG